MESESGAVCGVAQGEQVSDEDFKERLEAMAEELEMLNCEARDLEQRIAENLIGIIAKLD